MRLLRVPGPLIRRRLYAIDSVLRQFLDCGVSTTPINDRRRASREIVDLAAEFRESRQYRSAVRLGAKRPADDGGSLAPGASCSPGSREPTKSEVGTIDYTLERDESENADRYM